MIDKSVALDHGVIGKKPLSYEWMVFISIQKKFVKVLT